MGNAIYDTYKKVTLPVKFMTTFLTHFKFNALSLDMIPFVFHLLKQDGFITAINYKIAKDHIKKFFKSKNISLQVIIRVDNFFKKYDVNNGSIAFKEDIHKLLDIVISLFKNDKTTTDEENSTIGICKNIVIKEDVVKIEKLMLIKKIFTDLTDKEIQNIMQNIIFVLRQMISKPEEYGLECPDSKSEPKVETTTRVPNVEVTVSEGRKKSPEKYDTVLQAKRSTLRDVNTISKTQSNKGGRKNKLNKKRTIRKK